MNREKASIYQEAEKIFRQILPNYGMNQREEQIWFCHAALEAMRGTYTKIIVTPYQPTCENMVEDFARAIAAELPAGVELFSVKLHETATSFAEWYASDNL